MSTILLFGRAISLFGSEPYPRLRTDTRGRFSRGSEPVLSVDLKKKKIPGNFNKTDTLALCMEHQQVLGFHFCLVVVDFLVHGITQKLFYCAFFMSNIPCTETFFFFCGP